MGLVSVIQSPYGCQWRLPEVMPDGLANTGYGTGVLARTAVTATLIIPTTAVTTAALSATARPIFAWLGFIHFERAPIYFCAV